MRRLSIKGFRRSTRFQAGMQFKTKPLGPMADLPVQTIFILGTMKENIPIQRVAEKYETMVRMDEELYGPIGGILLFFPNYILLILQGSDDFKKQFLLKIYEDLQGNSPLDKNTKIMTILTNVTVRSFDQFTWILAPEQKEIKTLVDNATKLTTEQIFVNTIIQCNKVVSKLKGIDEIDEEITKLSAEDSNFLPKVSNLALIDQEITHLLTIEEHVKKYFEKCISYIPDEEIVWPAPKHRYI